MDDDLTYIPNYRANHLYTIPAKEGAYAKLVGEGENFIGEIEVTERTRIAISAFHVRAKDDFDSFKISKLKFDRRHGWKLDGAVRVAKFHLQQMREFVSIISSLDLRDVQKTRISLENVSLGNLEALLASTEGVALVETLAQSPELHRDIYAVASKRAALESFRAMLQKDTKEADWQNFFEHNTWIFGHGLNFISLSKVTDKLETITIGNCFDRPGKRADALMRTRAIVSQYVLVEIKRNRTDLLRTQPHRPGCWGASDELSKAITQTQKTVFDFSRNRFRDHAKDRHGADMGISIYSVEPRSYLVIGSLDQIKDNDDKIACFELYRRNIRSPEIITFDELFERATCIVENISHQESEATSST